MDQVQTNKAEVLNFVNGLPIIKHTLDFIKDNDADYIEECIAVLEHLSESSNIKDEEIDVIGELISNLYGAIEVNRPLSTDPIKKMHLINLWKE